VIVPFHPRVPLSQPVAESAVTVIVVEVTLFIVTVPDGQHPLVLYVVLLSVHAFIMFVVESTELL